MRQQFVAHTIRIGIGPVHLVDRDNDRHTGRLGMINCFDRLRHDAVIGGNHQHHDIRRAGAARSHCRESLMAGSVEERNLVAARHPDLIGADMLRDATGFTCNDICRPQCIQQRGLAVIDMTHDGDDRGARLKIRIVLVGIAFQADLDIGFGNTLGRVAKFSHDQLRGLGINRFRDRRHDPDIHQRLDNVDGALGHTIREFLHRDSVWNNYFSEHFF